MVKNLAYLAIFTSFIVALWIGLTVYHNISSTTISEIAQIQIAPISATFNSETISLLKKRQQVSADLAKKNSATQIQENTSTASATPTPSQIQNQIFTPNEEF